MIARRIPAIAALLCATSVALGAVASHGLAGQAKERLAMAALFAFGHGLALLVIGSRHSSLATACKLMFLAGIALFSGSLAAAAFFSTPTVAAPAGGMLLIGAWLLLAADCWRRD